jgi:hypothetical protein
VKAIDATQDINAQREIEKQLHKSNERYNMMLMATNELLWEWGIKKSGRNINKVINEIKEFSRSLMDPPPGDSGIIDSINDLIENINFAKK